MEILDPHPQTAGMFGRIVDNPAGAKLEDEGYWSREYRALTPDESEKPAQATSREKSSQGRSERRQSRRWNDITLDQQFTLENRA